MPQLLITRCVADSRTGCSYDILTLSFTAVILSMPRTNGTHINTALLSIVPLFIPLITTYSLSEVKMFFFFLFSPLSRLAVSL